MASKNFLSADIFQVFILSHNFFGEFMVSASFDALSGLSDGKKALSKDDCKVIAFYLPQFHRVPENSEWWGPGFTEWTNVAQADRNYINHYQPHVPRELGFYDLSNVEVMREQAALAREYGVTAFCFHHYWFSGNRILEKPLDNFINSDIDHNFCICWANENWTRTWDGDDKSVLMEQEYKESDRESFFKSILPYISDERYIRVDDMPLLVVYRAMDIPECKRTFAIWRRLAVESGFKGLHIAAVDFYDISRPEEAGADALIEFPPHKFNSINNIPDYKLEITNEDFQGTVLDYVKVASQGLFRERPDFNLYRGLIPSWDNTARRQNTPTIIDRANPTVFESWLKFIRAYTREYQPSGDKRLIFINAWNEWGEGCHLEPDLKWGLGYLEAVARSQYYYYGSLEEARASSLKSLENYANMPVKPSTYQPRSRFVELGARLLAGFPVLYRVSRKLYRMVR